MSGHTDNKVVIEAPIDQVWTVTNDVASWPSLFSEYASAEILETAENYVKFRLTISCTRGGWRLDRSSS
jgi:aromatase